MTQDNGMDVTPTWVELRDENERLRAAMHEARKVVGDAATGPAGLHAVDILERALRGGRQ